MSEAPLRTDDRATSMLKMRLEGHTYEVIAEKHCVSPKTAQRYCAMAMRRGEVTPEQIQFRVKAQPAHLGGDAQYHPWWIAKVKRNIVVNEKGCWIWQGNRNSHGYGQTAYRGKTKILHRRFYQVIHGVKLARWVYVCHRCDERLCINPDHLWLGTPKQNSEDMIAKKRQPEQTVTHCPLGHAYDAQNTYWVKAKSGRLARNCKACQRIRGRLKSGWSFEEATADLTPTPPGVRTARRHFSGRAA